MLKRLELPCLISLIMIIIVLFVPKNEDVRYDARIRAAKLHVDHCQTCIKLHVSVENLATNPLAGFPCHYTQADLDMYE